MEATPKEISEYENPKFNFEMGRERVS